MGRICRPARTPTPECTTAKSSSPRVFRDFSTGLPERRPTRRQNAPKTWVFRRPAIRICRYPPLMDARKRHVWLVAYHSSFQRFGWGSSVMSRRSIKPANPAASHFVTAPKPSNVWIVGTENSKSGRVDSTALLNLARIRSVRMSHRTSTFLRLGWGCRHRVRSEVAALGSIGYPVDNRKLSISPPNAERTPADPLVSS